MGGGGGYFSISLKPTKKQVRLSLLRHTSSSTRKSSVRTMPDIYSRIFVEYEKGSARTAVCPTHV